MLEWLETSEYAQWMLGESLFGWPFMLTIHAFGTAVVIGFIFIIDLRLLGFFRTIPYNSLNRMLQVLWIALVLKDIKGSSF